MKKLIATLILTAIATQASAGVADICNMKSSQYERDQCIEYGARGGMLRVKGNTDRLLQSNRVPDSEKQDIVKSHKKWASKVESKCSDNECYWDMSRGRNNELERIMSQYGITPM